MISADSLCKKGIAVILLCVLLQLLCPLSFQVAFFRKQQGETKGVSTTGAVDNQEDNDNYTVFSTEHLTDVRDKLSANHVHMRRIVRDLRDFLAAHVPSSLGEKQGGEVFSRANEFLRTLDLKLQTLAELGGEKARIDLTMKSLREFVERWIHYLQNPSDCRTARKLLCKLTRPDGLGSGTHDILYCFVIGLRTGRTVVLDSRRWHRAPGKKWTKTFLPLTSCANVSLADALVLRPGQTHEVASEIADLPSTIAKPLVASHGDPYAWWYGQIMAYILRLQDSTKKQIEHFKKVNGYKKPIVGIHVRRRDKIHEAGYHSVEQYMSHVKGFYRKLALTRKVDQKRVFVATDEPNVIVEIQKKFPGYTFIFDKATAREASTFSSRERPSALSAAMRDVVLLAESDFIVCTFSSGFCRIAYELMQPRHSDASNHAASLDLDYYYAYIAFPARGTLYENRPYFPSELNMVKGQIVRKAYCDHCIVREAREMKLRDGYQKGSLSGSEEAGIFPTYKTVQLYRVAQYAPPADAFFAGRDSPVLEDARNGSAKPDYTVASDVESIVRRR